MAISVKWGNEVSIEPVSWCWQPFIPYGRLSMFLGNNPDTREAALRLAAICTDRKKPPTLENGELTNEDNTDPIPILYVSGQESFQTVETAFSDCGGNANYWNQSVYGLSVDDLQQTIEQTHAGIVILDIPVSEMQSFSRVARKTGAAIILFGDTDDVWEIPHEISTVIAVENEKDNILVRLVRSSMQERDYTPVRFRLAETGTFGFSVSFVSTKRKRKKSILPAIKARMEGDGSA